MRKKFYLSKQFMKDTGIVEVLIDNTIPYALRIKRKDKISEVHARPIVTEHKYGKTMTYYYFSFSHAGKFYQIPVADMSYLLANDIEAIPDGYEVDHINDRSTDNRSCNLQLLSHADNIRKRGKSRNQYDFIKKVIV